MVGSLHRFPIDEVLTWVEENHPNDTGQQRTGEATLNGNRENRKRRPAQKASDLGAAEDKVGFPRHILI
jgi:hypothetical protein